MSVMRDEIFEQPQVIERLVRQEGPNIARVAAELRSRQPAFIVIAARGTSDNAATYAKYLFGLINHTVVALAAPSLITLYGGVFDLRHAAVIGISQSGESADVAEVIGAGRAAGAFTIAITNNPVSPLARQADRSIMLHAGQERALPATKTYTTELTALALLSAHMVGDRDLLDGIDALPEIMQAVLSVAPVLEQAAQLFRHRERYVCLARGFNYATALEAALKLKETCYVGAEPYSTADFLHGPIAVLEPGFPALLFAAPGRAQEPTMRMADALRSHGAASIIIGCEGDILRGAAIAVPMPATVDELLSPIPYVVPAQLFAEHLARAKGLDPDSPRGLRKVTITR